MVNWDQKLKMPITCEKQFYKNIRVVLCKKPFRKNTKYSRNKTIWKIGHLAKAIAHANAIAFTKMVSLGQKLKMPKTCENSFYKNIRVVLCKKTVRKNTKYSRNDTILKIGPLAKAIAFARWPIFKIASILEYLVFFRAVFLHKTTVMFS